MQDRPKKTYDQIAREGSPEEISATLPPTGKYIPVKIRRAVYERDGHVCFFCGSGDKLSLDHFVARALGGPNTIDNLFTVCMPCNIKKGAIGPGYIIERMNRGIKKFGAGKGWK